uniref:Uncharacterized protein n=1 Tax=Anguilla anguilla TaxID=7936 RepID=A0A0E9T5P3_ANGAN
MQSESICTFLCFILTEFLASLRVTLMSLLSTVIVNDCM